MNSSATLPGTPLAEPTPLNEDQQAVVLRNLREAMYACQTILEAVAQTPQVPEVAPSALSVAEFRLADAARALGIETDGTEQRTQRYADIRRANERVRELERLLGQGASAQQTQAALKVLSERLNKWWDREGFGHISDLHFTQYGHLEVTFSCMLFGAFCLTESRTPVSDKQRKAEWLQDLATRGYDVVDAEDSRDMELLDTDASRQVLMRLFRRDLPSARVTEFGNHGGRSGRITMRHVKVFIYALDDVEQLDVGAEAAAAD